MPLVFWIPPGEVRDNLEDSEDRWAESRPLRLEYPGAVWHVTSRGNERRDIFRDDQDRRLFLRLLARAVARHRWRLHAFVPMTNHHHLLVETPEPNLSRGMHEINGAYAQKFNRRHERIGHLLQGRFKGILVGKESHLLELVRYIVLNPVRAGLADDPAAWPWSSYCATARLAPLPTWLEVGWTLGQFGPTQDEAVERYVAFVRAGLNSRSRPFAALKGRMFLGDDRLRRRVREELSRVRVSEEVPRLERALPDLEVESLIRATAAATGASLETIRRGRGGEARLLVAMLAREHTTASLRFVGTALSVQPSRVSRLAAQGVRLLERDPSFRRTADRVIAQIARRGSGEKTKGKT